MERAELCGHLRQLEPVLGTTRAYDHCALAKTQRVALTKNFYVKCAILCGTNF